MPTQQVEGIPKETESLGGEAQQKKTPRKIGGGFFIGIVLALFGLYACDQKNQTPAQLKIAAEYDPRPAVVQVRTPEYGHGFRIAAKPFEIYNGREIFVDIRNAGAWLQKRSPELRDAPPANYPKPENLNSLDPATYFDPVTEAQDYKLLKPLLDPKLVPTPEETDKIHELVDLSHARRDLEPWIVKALSQARLVLNGVVLSDLTPEVIPGWEEWIATGIISGKTISRYNRYNSLRFTVAITDTNKTEWKSLLCDLGFNNSNYSGI